MLRDQKGFTLVEMATVISIIAMLTALILPSVSDMVKEAKILATEAEIHVLVSALLRFHADTGVWPADDDAAPADGNSDPDLMGGDCANGSLGSTGTEGIGLLCKGRMGNQKAALPGDVATAVNAGNGVKQRWRGPYITKQAGSNPFGGSYVLDNQANVFDPVDGGEDLEIKDVVLLVTGLPIDVMTRIDADLDDGNLATGGIFRKTGTSTLKVVVAVY